MNPVIVYSSMAMSLDGFTAGNNQSFDNPFGDNFDPNLLRCWMFPEDEKKIHQKEIDAILDAGAYIMGSNMFGPVDRRLTPEWKGWWGPTPPYHAPVFVLTHTPREPIVMEGGTTFYFVTDGIESALSQAKSMSGGRNISIAGGASTVNQFLQKGLIDELRLHIVPATIGSGTRLFDGVHPLSLKPLEISGNHLVTHIRYQVLK